MDAVSLAKKEYVERFGKVPLKDDPLFLIVLEQKKAEIKEIIAKKGYDVRKKK